MIEALIHSANDDVARVCRKLKNPKEYPDFDPEQYHRMCGGFMRCVLNGESNLALNRADRSNKRILDRALDKKFKEFIERYS